MRAKLHWLQNGDRYRMPESVQSYEVLRVGAGSAAVWAVGSRRVEIQREGEAIVFAAPSRPFQVSKWSSVVLLTLLMLATMPSPGATSPSTGGRKCSEPGMSWQEREACRFQLGRFTPDEMESGYETTVRRREEKQAREDMEAQARQGIPARDYTPIPEMPKRLVVVSQREVAVVRIVSTRITPSVKGCESGIYVISTYDQQLFRCTGGVWRRPSWAYHLVLGTDFTIIPGGAEE